MQGIQLELQLFAPIAEIQTAKVISLKQPYAWALFNGKDIENRTWRTNHRGLLLIHASASKSKSYWIEAAKVCYQQGLVVPGQSFLTYGAIIGAVEVVDCRWSDDVKGWGFAQHWHWKIENPRLFREPVPAKGTLGLFSSGLSPQEVNKLCAC